MMTCQSRGDVLRDSIESLRQSDWGEDPLVFVDPCQGGDPKANQVRNAHRILLAVQQNPDWEWLIFCEDDVVFNRHLRHNLRHWNQLYCDAFRVGSLYCVHSLETVPAWEMGGSQAIVIRRQFVEEILRNWDKPEFADWLQDLRIYRSVTESILVHIPNLVQHRSAGSTWGGPAHASPTFDLDWRAKEA